MKHDTALPHIDDPMTEVVRHDDADIRVLSYDETTMNGGFDFHEDREPLTPLYRDLWPVVAVLAFALVVLLAGAFGLGRLTA